MGLLFCAIFSLQTLIVSSLSQFEGISNYVFERKQFKKIHSNNAFMLNNGV